DVRHADPGNECHGHRGRDHAVAAQRARVDASHRARGTSNPESAMHGMLKNRAGFTLAEVLIALTLTAIIGAAVTGVFVSQSRFFDHQEKVGAAREVSRGALNIMMSEMRMLHQDSAIVSATDRRITLRVPYAFGFVCE